MSMEFPALHCAVVSFLAGFPAESEDLGLFLSWLFLSLLDWFIFHYDYILMAAVVLCVFLLLIMFLTESPDGRKGGLTF